MTTPVDPTPLHVEIPPILRKAADSRPVGPHRDAILRLADELESTGNVDLVSHRTVMDAIDAYLDESHLADDT